MERLTTSWMAGIGFALLLVGQAFGQTTDQEPRSAESWVEQLGDPRFINREIATESLTRMGLDALDAVRQGTQHSDPEVRFRSRLILRAIRHLDRQRLIQLFMTNQGTQSGEELPGWTYYRQLIEDTPDSRSLYVQMLEEEWTFLEQAFEGGGVDVGQLIGTRCQSLQNTLRLRRTVSVGSIASLLLAASQEQVTMDNQLYLMSFCHLNDFDRAMRVGTFRKPLRILLGKIVEKEAHDALLSQQLSFALKYDLTEGLEHSRRLLKDQPGAPHIRQYALLLLGKIGTDEDLQIVDQMLGDATEVASRKRGNNVISTTQICDLALTILIMRADENPADYGLPAVQLDPTTMFRPASVGFASETERQEAIAKWRNRKESVDS